VHPTPVPAFGATNILTFMKTKPCNTMPQVLLTGIFRPKFPSPLLSPNGRGNRYGRLGNLLLLVALAAAANRVGGEPAQSRQIAVGDRAPSFVLKDQNDQEFSLEAMVKKGPVAVVFIRSIEWCAYCQLQTVQLSENLTRIQAAGGQVVMVCYDAPEKVKRFTRRRKIGIPILSDAGSKTIEAYAMRAVNGAGDQLGSAQHGTFVIDRSGIVRSKPYLMSFEGAAAVEALASALKQADTPR
jgi:peroxiredoxin